MDSFWFAFGLTVFAGLATGIGSLIAFFSKTANKRFLSVALGFSAGVMVYVSMVEIFQKAKDSLIQASDEVMGTWLTVIAFFGGVFVIALIDKLIPSYENPHEVRLVSQSDFPEQQHTHPHLLRTGMFVAIALAIHNFPEGLATFIAGLENPSLGIPIAVAIAIHNIPEGISVSVPIYYATENRKKAFIYSFLSGLAEPVGALVGYFLILPFMNDFVFGLLFAAVAGIMVFISFDELLPAAREYGEHHLSIYGLFAGMAVMAVSLLMFI